MQYKYDYRGFEVLWHCRTATYYALSRFTDSQDVIVVLRHKIEIKTTIDKYLDQLKK